MRRIHRPFGRGQSSNGSLTASAICKIGGSTPGDRGGKTPYWFGGGGFILLNGSLTPKVGDVPAHYAPHYGLMEKLGFGKDAVDKALQFKRNATPGMLPQDLVVAIRFDAALDPESQKFDFPGTFIEAYGCFAPKDKTKGGPGYFCRGDGERASRRVGTAPNFTRDFVPCNPKGKDGIAPEQICPFSAAGECKPEGKLVFSLLVFNEDLRRYVPASGVKDETFILESHSDVSLGNILDELDRAAAKCNGFIAGLVATLKVRVKNRQQPGSATAPLPVITLEFHPSVLEERAQRVHNRYIESRAAERGIIDIKPTEPAALLDPPKSAPDDANDLAREAEFPDRSEAPEDMNDHGAEECDAETKAAIEASKPDQVDDLVDGMSDEEVVGALKSEVAAAAKQRAAADGSKVAHSTVLVEMGFDPKAMTAEDRRNALKRLTRERSAAPAGASA